MYQKQIFPKLKLYIKDPSSMTWSYFPLLYHSIYWVYSSCMIHNLKDFFISANFHPNHPQQFYNKSFPYMKSNYTNKAKTRNRLICSLSIKTRPNAVHSFSQNQTQANMFTVKTRPKLMFTVQTGPNAVHHLNPNQTQTNMFTVFKD